MKWTRRSLKLPITLAMAASGFVTLVLWYGGWAISRRAGNNYGIGSASSATDVAGEAQLSEHAEVQKSNNHNRDSSDLISKPIDSQAGDRRTPDVTRQSAGFSGSKSEEARHVAQAEEGTKTAHPTASALGRKIRISESVENRCKEVSPRWVNCPDVEAMLEQMAKEERDEPWASKTEAKIRACTLEKLTDADFRTLECRKSLCAVEVASIFGSIDFLDEDQREICGVDDWWHTVYGYERDPSSAEITVTLSVFERRVETQRIVR